MNTAIPDSLARLVTGVSTEQPVEERNQRIIKMFIDDCLPILDAKGHDYTDQKDALSNFYQVAEQTGQTPLQVWAIYLLKHLSAIMTYVRHGQVESEPIEGRFTDAINYLFLGRLIIEREADTNKKEGVQGYTEHPLLDGSIKPKDSPIPLGDDRAKTGHAPTTQPRFSNHDIPC